MLQSQHCTYNVATFFLTSLGRKLLCFLIAISATLSVFGQSAYHNYINTYAPLAVEQMRRYKIPASITLAQGLLESAAGQSRLAKKANNHFGIKKGTGWDGPTIRHNDDLRGERFRKYNSPLESYEDHSKFLANGKRYASLFCLKMDDYKGWAKGLKKAGYATNPRYATELINIIERYKLYEYDKMVKATNNSVPTMTTVIQPTITPVTTPQNALPARSGDELNLRSCNNNYYIIARQGDTYRSLGRIFGISARKLRKYNEAPKKYELRAGDIVYIKKKEKKAHKSLKGKRHVIQPGESLYDIAQKYAMRVETLYKINKLSEDYAPQVGHELLIRK